MNHDEVQFIANYIFGKKCMDIREERSVYGGEHEHKEAALDHITAQLRLIDDRNRNLEKRIIKLESEFRNDL